MSREGYLGLAAGLLGIIVSVIQSMHPLIPSFVGWPIVAILGMAFFVLCDMGIRKGQYEERLKQDREVNREKSIIEPQKGSLETVTRKDRSFIILLSQSMLIRHGHIDIEGLLADRASGIPLNELIGRNCSRCGRARNKKGTKY